MRPSLWIPVLAAFSGLVSAPASASDHLLITEVLYDPVTNPETNEWIEIHNPTAQDVVLNDGLAAYYLSDDEDVYWLVVNGVLVPNSSSDWVLGFPVGAVLPAGGYAVVTGNATAWLAEFAPNGLQAFLDLPGAPQLFEFQTNTNTVPDMIRKGSILAMSLTNSGEDVTLFRWDGVSDRVQDVDHVCWFNLTELVDKTGVSIDGPDVDAVATVYLADAGGAVAAADASSGRSIQRRHGVEINEAATGGNGITGHDETTENWASGFIVSLPTPGQALFALDGDVADLAGVGAPLAVSGADGAGVGPVLDFGDDGTITELYAVPVDVDLDGIADVLRVGVRGSFFTSAAAVNGVFVGLDLNPGSGAGAIALDLNGADASDLTGTLDGHLTESGIVLAAGPVADGYAFDAVFGVTTDGCVGSDVCGLRGFGTDGAPGTLSDFAFLGDFAGLTDVELGSSLAALPGAFGTVIAGPEGIEFLVSLAELGDPTIVGLAAWVSADGPSPGGLPSPNTLPENASDALLDVQEIEEVVCVAMEAVGLPVAYLDGDGDGFGDAASPVTWCALPPAGSSGVPGDCDDGDAGVGLGTVEVCDGADQSCDGVIDEGFDADGDGFFDGANAGCVAAYAQIDCDDGLASVSPAGVEVCSGGLDEDCDGTIDALDLECVGGDDDDSAGDDDDSAGDDDDSGGDDDDSAGDDDDSTADDDDSTADDDDSTADDDDSTADDDDSVTPGDDDDDGGCTCDASSRSAVEAPWGLLLLTLAGAQRRRRGALGR